jgi:hypothetical protein
MPRRPRPTLTNRVVHRVQPGGVHPDEHLAIARGRLRNLAQLQRAGAPVTSQHIPLHSASTASYQLECMYATITLAWRVSSVYIWLSVIHAIFDYPVPPRRSARRMFACGDGAA